MPEENPVRNEPAPGPILVTFAVKEEGKFLKRPAGVHVLITGMGHGNAETSLLYGLEKVAPRMVLTCGFAGGLNPVLKNGQIIFHAEAGSMLESVLQKTEAMPVNFFCARRVAITSEEKQKLWRGTGLDAIEMESETIRDICRERDIPCATIRVISDSAMEDLPLDFNTLMTPAQKIHYGKLSWALVRSPWKLAELLAFQQRSMDAARSLAAYLRKILQPGVLG